MSFADPLWEFVLEDYEDEESTLLSRFSRNKTKKPEKIKKKDDNKSSTGSRGFLSSSKRANRSEYRDEKDGLWDVISGKPPKATRLKRSKSFSSRGRNMLSKKGNTKPRSSSLTRSQSSLSISEQDAMSSNNRKKSFKQRFSWNQNQKSSENSAMREYSAHKVNVKHTSLVDDRDDSKTADENYESTFDPMDLLFQIADTLDPWGLESEASSSDEEGSVTDDEADRSSHVTSNVGSETYTRDAHRSRSVNRSSPNAQNKKLDSLLDQQLPKTTRSDSNRYPYHSEETRETNGHSTEIRLRFNPVGKTLSEEVSEKRTNIDDDQEQYLRKVPSDEEKHPMFTPSFDDFDARQSTPIFKRESNRPDFAANNKRENFVTSRERRQSDSEEKRAPANVRTSERERAQSNIRDDDGKELGNTKPQIGLKKAICGLKKVEKNNNLRSRFRKLDAVEGFPSTRLVIDGESHLVSDSDLVRGMMGPMIGSKGPQPIFAYDYESNMNMDVSYAQPNQKPKTSISVRKLGPPPPITSVLGVDNIVIQVEVRIMSFVVK